LHYLPKVNDAFDLFSAVFLDELIGSWIATQLLYHWEFFHRQIENGKRFDPKIGGYARGWIEIKGKLLKPFRKIEELLASFDLRLAKPSKFVECFALRLLELFHHDFQA